MPPVVSLALQILGLLHLASKEVEGLTPSYTIAHKIAVQVDNVANLIDLIAPQPAPVIPGVPLPPGK